MGVSGETSRDNFSQINGRHLLRRTKKGIDSSYTALYLSRLAKEL